MTSAARTHRRCTGTSPGATPVGVDRPVTSQRVPHGGTPKGSRPPCGVDLSPMTSQRVLPGGTLKGSRPLGRGPSPPPSETPLAPTTVPMMGPGRRGELKQSDTPSPAESAPGTRACLPMALPAIPLRTCNRQGGIAPMGYTSAATAMGTKRPIASAIRATTMGVVRPDDVIATIVPSPVVEAPLMGMVGRPMTSPSPVTRITGSLEEEGIPQAEGLDMAWAAITAEARAGLPAGDLAVTTIRAADLAVRPAADPTQGVMTTDRGVLAAVGEAGETVMEADRVVHLAIGMVGNPMPPSAPVRALGLATQVTRPGSAKSRTKLT